MAKKVLTDRLIKALKPAQPGQRYLVMDVVVPGHGVLVTDTGHKSYVLIARFPPSRNPTRGKLGDFGAIDLAASRDKARAWIEQLQRGVDPRKEAERVKREGIRQQQHTLASVFESFAKKKLITERRGREVKRDLRRDLLPGLGGMAITKVTELDVLSILETKKGSAGYNLYCNGRRLFDWAQRARVYGLTSNPFVNLKPKDLFGPLKSGDRTFTDDEWMAFMRAAKRMPYPVGAVYQMLAMTGLRLNEAADASWPEFDLRNRTWVIPAARMKGTESKARAHAVPITDDMVVMLNSLPRFNSGAFTFSITHGRSPIWMGSKVKAAIDKRMLRTLKALVRKRGEDPDKVTLPAWKNHDVRRSVRSQLSRLKVAEEVREAILAHVRPGIKGVYDQHGYLDEKRAALELWAARLKSLTNPQPPESNVVALRA
jgi:integrase